MVWLTACEYFDFTDGPRRRDDRDGPRDETTSRPETGDTGEVPAPGDGFEALVYHPGDPFEFEPRLARFDGDGCLVSEVEVPIQPGVHQLVTTSGRWFATFVGGFGEVDPETGALRPIPYPAPFDDVSWEMSVAVDPATDEVLIGTLGGRGDLLAYDPASAAFSRRGSFDDADIVAMAALPDGSLDAFRMPGSYDDGVTTLLRYDVTDLSPLGSRSLDRSLPMPESSYGFFHDSQTWQLRVSGEELFAVVRAEEPERVRTSRVRPRTGEVIPSICP